MCSPNLPAYCCPIKDVDPEIHCGFTLKAASDAKSFPKTKKVAERTQGDSMKIHFISFQKSLLAILCNFFLLLLSEKVMLTETNVSKGEMKKLAELLEKRCYFRNCYKAIALLKQTSIVQRFQLSLHSFSDLAGGWSLRNGFRHLFILHDLLRRYWYLHTVPNLRVCKHR